MTSTVRVKVVNYVMKYWKSIIMNSTILIYKICSWMVLLYIIWYFFVHCALFFYTYCTIFSYIMHNFVPSLHLVLMRVCALTDLVPDLVLPASAAATQRKVVRRGKWRREIPATPSRFTPPSADMFVSFRQAWCPQCNVNTGEIAITTQSVVGISMKIPNNLEVLSFEQTVGTNITITWFRRAICLLSSPTFPLMTQSPSEKLSPSQSGR